MKLLLPALLKRQPLAQAAAVLVLGQGWNDPAEFLTLAKRLVARLVSVPAFAATEANGLHEGRLIVVADACIGVDLGLSAPLPAAPRALVLDDGSKLAAALAGLKLPAPVVTDPAATTADRYFGLVQPSGSAAKLVVILRKPPAGAGPPAEYYNLPIVAVDVVATRAWPLVVVRALAQLIAGLGDEFTRSGADWQAPPAQWHTDPQYPTVVQNFHRLGLNTIMVKPAQALRLGHEPIWQILGRLDIDPAWLDRKWEGETPYRAVPGGAVVGDRDRASIRLVQGAGGFRTRVLRFDAPCLLAQVPAAPAGTTAPLGDPIGAPQVGLCPVCEALTARALGDGWDTTRIRRRGLDQQRSQFDDVWWPERTTVAVTGAGQPTKVAVTVSRGAVWKFTAAVDALTGLRITDLKLALRPDDPMFESEDVAESITFGGIGYDTGAGRQSLAVADALASTEYPPTLVIGKAPIGAARVGVQLILHWQPEEGLLIRAEMSLVCRTIANDFDPGGAAEACKFFPELTLTWVEGASTAPPVSRLYGEVVILANNRLTGHHHEHGMVPESQTVMILTDSNTSKSDSSNIITTLFIPPLPPVPVAVWRAGRLLGHLDEPPGVAAYLGWQAGLPLLPEWSWLFDYGRSLPVGQPEISEVVVWESGVERGDRERTQSVQWPPEPDTLWPGKPSMTVRKVPRQGNFDNIHINADMGQDSVGRQLIAAPFCADLCLHLHVRWGIHATDAATTDAVPFLGWSSGPHAEAHAALGAPLVPPNQRVTFRLSRPSAAKTRIRYCAEVASPRRGSRQVILEQGLGFAFTYNGLKAPDRTLLGGAYLTTANAALYLDFMNGDDSAIREVFRSIYERIRYYTYGVEDTSTLRQQIPTDAATGPYAPGESFFRSLVER